MYQQLDSLSREDLIKYVRKQAQLLQKSKAKCDGRYLHTHEDVNIEISWFC